ncbi:MAG: DinB family protein [Pseudomonadota bacterium]
MKALFSICARYNQWANQRLYDAAFSLPDADYRADLGAAFGSIHGTLNHILVGDRVWLARFEGHTNAPKALDAIIAETQDGLRAERRATDEAIIAYVAGLSDETLAAPFTYTSIVNPKPVTQPLAPALLHAFNHQTHHRGQAHALLTRLTGEAPSLDLIYYQRETGDGLSALQTN